MCGLGTASVTASLSRRPCILTVALSGLKQHHVVAQFLVFASFVKLNHVSDGYAGVHAHVVRVEQGEELVVGELECRR